jgi:hypothetical protein
MVVYRTAEHRALEIARLLVLNRAAAVIQKRLRGVYVRMHVSELELARTKLKKAIIARDNAQLNETIAHASQLFFKVKEVYDAECVREAIRQETELRPRLEAALALEMSECECEAYDLSKVLHDEIVRLQKRDPLAFANMDVADKLVARFAVLEALRASHSQLQSALAQAQTCTLGGALARLDECINEAARVSSMSGANDGICLVDAITQARTLQDRLMKEQKLVDECASYASLCTIKGVVNELDVTGANEHIGAYYDSLTALDGCTPLSVDGKDAFKSMDAMYELRVAVLSALVEAEGGQADSPEWRHVETLLKKVVGMVHDDNGTEEGVVQPQTPKLFEVSLAETRLIGAELAFRSAVDDVVAKLLSGIDFVDDELLAVALDQATALELSTHSDAQIRDVTAQAAALLPRINQARSLLHHAYAAVSEELLREALAAQDACQYGVAPDRVGYELVEGARRLLGWVEELTRQAGLAVKLLYVEPTQAIVQGCHEIGLSLPELQSLEAFLAMPHGDRLVAQRKAAARVGNYRRAVRLSMEIHSDRLARPGELNNKSLQHFPLLKTPEEFAKRFGIGWKRYKASMLQHYNPAFGKLHTTLTRIDCGTDEETKSANRLGVHLFKNILGVMGDKMTENQDGLAQEVLAKGLEHKSLRDEIYCQLMKQLTNNPKPNSVKRGWNLMAMCLFTFPPSKHLSDYLEAFLITNAQSACVLKLHQCLVAGELKAPPCVREVSRRRSPGVVTLWFDDVSRTRYEINAQMWSGEEVVQQHVRDWKQGLPAMTPDLRMAEDSNFFNADGGGSVVGNESPPLWSDVGAPPPPPPKRPAPRGAPPARPSSVTMPARQGPIM